MQLTIPSGDLEHVLTQAAIPLRRLEKASIFLTGAKGFLGIWLIEALLYANNHFGLNLKIYALTRSAKAFYEKFPHLASDSHLKIVEGTVLRYEDTFPSADYIIHGANLPDTHIPGWATQHMLYGVAGTQNIFQTAKKYGTQSVLVTSSGAVYRDMCVLSGDKMAEEHLRLDNKEPSVYASTKRIMEQLAFDFHATSNIPVSVARCFALAGPHLPLHHFALGNFIHNAMNKQALVIKGTGQAMRSYMYGSDLVIWLLHLLVLNKGANPWNVGSDCGITIKELAECIGRMYDLPVRVLGQTDFGNAPNIYVPDTGKAKKAFGLQCTVPLETIIKKMYDWYVAGT